MKSFFQLPSYIFHPLWMPTIGIASAYLVVPVSFEQINIISDVILVFFFTILIPLAFLLVLKKIKVVKSLHLKDVKERKLPILFFTCIAAFLINYVFPPETNQLFFYFFSGIFFSGILASVLTIANFKVSLHMIGLSGLMFFLYMILKSFQLNSLFITAISIVLLSWLASSRLHMKAHNFKELAIGIIVGASPQVYFFYDVTSWLD